MSDIEAMFHQVRVVCNQREEWLAELPRLAEFSVDRCFKPVEFGPVVSCQLHHFSDASESAYICCRVACANGQPR
jgi:hypothetical protein